MTTRHLRWSADATHSESHHAVAWSPNGQLLAGGRDDGCVYLWVSKDWTLRTKLSGHQGGVWSVEWSPDGRYLASGSGELFIWDVETAERVQTLVRHSGVVSALAWYPNGKALVSGDSNGQLWWWDVRSHGACPRGECVHSQEAHYRTIRSLKVSPDGAFLASCGEDGAIRIWDLHRREGFCAPPSLVRTLRRDRPYERLNITGIRGLTEAQKVSLRALGAIEEAIS
jgi:WD40 repeat protein